MNLKSYLRTGSAAAIAVALSFGALPTIAHADDNGRRGHLVRGGNDGDDGARAEARQARQQQRAAEVRQAPQQERTVRVPAQEQRTYQAPVAQERSGRDWNRGDRRSDTGTTRSGRDWNRGSDQGHAAAQAQAQAQARSRTTSDRDSRTWGSRRSGGTSTTSGNWERNRTYSDGSRNQTYREGYRDGRRTDTRQDRQQTQNAYRSGYRDGDRSDSWRDGRRGDHRSWSRDWRRDNRYDWSRYRTSNRNVFHIGRYYSPYSNYRYSRLSIGFRLNSLFFGSRYWINDPWQYRLPEAYGPYRWVRYYDDALLVDTYSGEVVDVIYDFFW